MPIYEYECAACGADFEILVKVTGDGTDVRCPACGASNPRRRLSSFAVGGASHDATCPTPDGASCAPDAPCRNRCPWEHR